MKTRIGFTVAIWLTVVCCFSACKADVAHETESISGEVEDTTQYAIYTWEAGKETESETGQASMEETESETGQASIEETESETGQASMGETESETGQASAEETESEIQSEPGKETEPEEQVLVAHAIERCLMALGTEGDIAYISQDNTLHICYFEEGECIDTTFYDVKAKQLTAYGLNVFLAVTEDGHIRAFARKDKQYVEVNEENVTDVVSSGRYGLDWYVGNMIKMERVEQLLVTDVVFGFADAFLEDQGVIGIAPAYGGDELEYCYDTSMLAGCDDIVWFEGGYAFAGRTPYGKVILSEHEPNESIDRIPEEWSGITDIVSSSQDYILGLTKEGRIVSSHSQWRQTENWENVTQLALCSPMVAALTEEGTIYIHNRNYGTKRELVIDEWQDIIYIQTDGTTVYGVDSQGRLYGADYADDALTLREVALPSPIHVK